MVSKLDVLSRSLITSRYFTKGWGNPGYLRSLFKWRQIISDRDQCFKLVPPDYPIIIDKDEQQTNCRIIEGHFRSPFSELIPGIMSHELETASLSLYCTGASGKVLDLLASPASRWEDIFQAVFPKKWEGPHKPVVIHLAGTGDHFFWRRRTLMARPLLKEAGIGSIILENPYYGLRKPKQQLRSNLHNVSDLFVMGGALVLESLALLHWCEREGLGPLGLTGISMGGHMASLAATNWPKPIALIPCLSWSTASTAFTKGVMSGAIPWKLLQEQYRSDTTFEDEFVQCIHSPENDRKKTAFMAGQQFARSYPASLQDMQTHWHVSGNNTSKDFMHNTGNSNKSGNNSSKDFINNAGNSDKSGNNSSKDFINNAGNSDKSGNSDKPSHTNGGKMQRSTNVSTKKENQNEQVLPPRSGNNIKKLWPNDVVSQLKRHLVELTESHTEQRETALNFMAGVMDEFTHLGNFSVPVDPSLIVIVVAKSDAYIPRESVISLKELWPEAQVRVLDAGHVSAFLFKQHVFRQAIIDSMKKLSDKYYS